MYRTFNKGVGRVVVGARAMSKHPSHVSRTLGLLRIGESPRRARRAHVLEIHPRVIRPAAVARNPVAAPEKVFSNEQGVQEMSVKL